MKYTILSLCALLGGWVVSSAVGCYQHPHATYVSRMDDAPDSQPAPNPDDRLP